MLRYLEVAIPGHGARRYRLGQQRVTIGSGRAAQLKLARAVQLDEKHIEVSPGADGCRIAICPGVASVVYQEGHARSAHSVPWGADVFVEGVRLTPVQAEARSHAQFVLFVVALLGLPVGVIALKNVGVVARLTDITPEAPALFGPLTPTCDHAGAEPAADRAMRAELEARGKIERFAFAPVDGLAAYALLREAGVCYRAGSDDEAATGVEREAERWRAKLEGAYAAHRAALAAALETGDQRRALREIANLKALLGSAERDAFVAWLIRQERRLRPGSQ